MIKHQVKFYVTDDEKKRLETLAKLRFMTIPNYAKMTALGVQIRQVKEVYIESDSKTVVYPQGEEGICMFDEILSLSEEDKSLLEELLQRSTGKGFIKYDTDFNERLQEMAKRLLN